MKLMLKLPSGNEVDLQRGMKHRIINLKYRSDTWCDYIVSGDHGLSLTDGVIGAWQKPVVHGLSRTSIGIIWPICLGERRFHLLPQAVRGLVLFWGQRASTSLRNERAISDISFTAVHHAVVQKTSSWSISWWTFSRHTMTSWGS